MSEVQIIIAFFAFLFAGSLFYSAKKKTDSIFSFILNLELEYIVVGAVLFYLAGPLTSQSATLHGIMYLLLAFMGLALGTHFSIKLLLDVPYRFYILTSAVYLTLIPLLYWILSVRGCEHPLIMAIALNTLMPYSLNLSMKLFRVPKDKVFVSNLTASLFPLFTLLAYSMGAGVVDYRPVDFTKALAGALVLSFVFLHYGKARTRKSLHNLSILFVVLISGISMYYGVSPLVLGFIIGLVQSDTKYGNMFQNISITFERIVYIFFYLVLGVMLSYGFSFSLDTVVTSVTLYACFALVRYFMAKYLVNWLMPTKGEAVCLISTGILPAVLLMDFGTRYGFANISGLFMPFFLLHMATEITTYFMMKNERKTD